MAVRIVTDGAVDLPAAWYKEFDIHRIPINVHFGEEKTYVRTATTLVTRVSNVKDCNNPGYRFV